MENLSYELKKYIPNSEEQTKILNAQPWSDYSVNNQNLIFEIPYDENLLDTKYIRVQTNTDNSIDNYIVYVHANEEGPFNKIGVACKEYHPIHQIAGKDNRTHIAFYFPGKYRGGDPFSQFSIQI